MSDVDQDEIESHFEHVRAFLANKLEPELAVAQAHINAIRIKASQYAEVRNLLKEPLEGEMRIDVGGDRCVTAQMDDTEHICIDVGFGFHPKLTHVEATRFLDEVSELQQHKLRIATERIGLIAARIASTRNDLEQIRHLIDIEKAQQTGRII